MKNSHNQRMEGDSHPFLMNVPCRYRGDWI
jgi:hypothetical protein